MNSLLRKLAAESNQIIHQIEVLRRSLERLSNRLIPESEYHPGLELIIQNFPRKMKDLALLFSIKELLPDFIALQVVETWNKRIAKLKGKELRYFLDYVDTIRFVRNDRFLQGRALVRLTFILKEMRVNFTYPRKPRKSNRPRGYKDHGSMRSTEDQYRSEAIPDYEIEKILRSPLTIIEEKAKVLLHAEDKELAEKESDRSLAESAKAASLERLAEASFHRRELGFLDNLNPTERNFDTLVKNFLDPYEDLSKETDTEGSRENKFSVKKMNTF